MPFACVASRPTDSVVQLILEQPKNMTTIESEAAYSTYVAYVAAYSAYAAYAAAYLAFLACTNQIPIAPHATWHVTPA